MSLKATQWGPLLEASHDPKRSLTSLERRHEARARLESAPMAAREAWRYTSLKSLRGVALSTSDAEVSAFTLSEELEVLSLNELLPQSVSPHPDPLTERALVWVRAELERAEPLMDLHATHAVTGQLLIVRASSSSEDSSKITQTLTHTLTVTHHRPTRSVGEGASVSAPSLWLYLEAGATLHLDERFTSAAGGVTVSATGLYLEAGARLEHTRAQLETQAAQEAPSIHLGRVNVEARARAHYALTTLNLGADLGRVELDIALAESEAEADLSGLYVGAGSVNLDQHLTVRHHAPRCVSSQRFRGVLGETSRGVFTGRIIVSEGASATTAHQHNPNLLLSERARAVTRPQLEIYNDDVECSHGATVGQLDEDALFYLRARGLSKPLALRALTAAFVGEVRSHLNDATLQAAIDHALGRALELDATRSEAREMWIDWESL